MSHRRAEKNSKSLHARVAELVSRGHWSLWALNVDLTPEQEKIVKEELKTGYFRTVEMDSPFKEDRGLAVTVGFRKSRESVHERSHFLRLDWLLPIINFACNSFIFCTSDSGLPRSAKRLHRLRRLDRLIWRFDCAIGCIVPCNHPFDV